MEILIPSRCTAGLPEDFDSEHLIAEEKLDGSRYVLYIGLNVDPYERRAGNTLLSRRVSVVDEKHVDKTDNLPHVTHPPYDGLGGTVLDGEVQASDFSQTNSIMNSSPALAISKQKELGLCTYWAFDVMYFRGKDVRHLPLEKRRKILEEVIKRMGNEHVKAIPQIHENFELKFKEIVARGGEGIILKDKRQAYGVGWAKMKKSYDVSTIITGWKPGKGKYASGIGSIEISVYSAGKLIPIGYASGFDDSLRAQMAKDFDKYKGKVVDVYTQEMSKPSKEHELGRLRHPTFHRLRDDFTATDCTIDKLRKDIAGAKKALSRRARE